MFEVKPARFNLSKIEHVIDNGQQVFAGEATRLAYMTEEATEGRNAFLEKRKPNFEKKYLLPNNILCTVYKILDIIIE